MLFEREKQRSPPQPKATTTVYDSYPREAGERLLKDLGAFGFNIWNLRILCSLETKEVSDWEMPKNKRESKIELLPEDPYQVEPPSSVVPNFGHLRFRSVVKPYATP